eukprot:scaffold16762_cov96-Isochrysis_galbana.AAC.2
MASASDAAVWSHRNCPKAASIATASAGRKRVALMAASEPSACSAGGSHSWAAASAAENSASPRPFIAPTMSGSRPAAACTSRSLE